LTQSARRFAASCTALDSSSRIRVTITLAGLLLCLATFPLEIRKAGTDTSAQSGEPFPAGVGKAWEADSESVSV
jgi:hypothetical protein